MGMEVLSPPIRLSPRLHLPPPLLSSPPPTRRLVAAAALKRPRPRGFGAPKPSGGGGSKSKRRLPLEEADGEEEEEEEEAAAAIPEVVTNRMMRRMALSVGAPLAAGLGSFPVFYYLKVAAKVDVPTWIPLGVSFVLFGAALLGVSYGIVSASWDPRREGSLLGWNEARRNWPVFWDSLRGRRP